MEEKEISIFNNEVEPISINVGVIPKVNYTEPTVGVSSYDGSYGNDNSTEKEQPSIFESNKPVFSLSLSDSIRKLSPSIGTGTTRMADDLTELSDYDMLTGESPYGSGKDDYMYQKQSTSEALLKGTWNLAPAFFQGVTMTPAALYSVIDRNFGTDNPYENYITDASDYMQSKKYRIWGKDGQLDISDAAGMIEQVGMSLGIQAGTALTMLPFAAGADILGAGAAVSAIGGIGIAGISIGEVATAMAMAYAEGIDGARGTYKDKYKQIYDETGNDEYAKKIAGSAANVETNTNILLNTALNIIPAKWLLKSNKLKAIDDVLEDTGLLNKYKPYQLADETLEDFGKRMEYFNTTNKTNLNRGVFDLTGKYSDLKYNLKNPKEFLNRNLDVVGEAFGEGLEEYHNYYAHELAMNINNERDIEKLNGTTSIPIQQIGKDIANAKFVKDMYNNKGFYDFASGAIVGGLTGPLMKKFKLNRSKIYNEETGEYEYKYKRAEGNPFKDIGFFEYQNSDYDEIDVQQQAINSLNTMKKMSTLIEDYNSAADSDHKDGIMQQITNIPLAKHLNQKTIKVYNAMLDKQIQGISNANKQLVNDNDFIEIVGKNDAATNSVTSYMNKIESDALKTKVKEYKDISAKIAAEEASGGDTRADKATRDGYLVDIKASKDKITKAISAHESELKQQLNYSKKLAEDYNETVESFTSKGVTRDNDYGFVNAYFMNKINRDAEQKLNVKLAGRYNTRQREIIDALKTNANSGYDVLEKQKEDLEKTNNAAGVNNDKIVDVTKKLADLESNALSGDADILKLGNDLLKSKIRLEQYNIEQRHLSESSYGDDVDSKLQKLEMKIRGHRNSEDMLDIISRYQHVSEAIKKAGISINVMDLLGLTSEQEAALQRHIDFSNNVEEYNKLADANKDNAQGHFLSKYFKANKRFVDELAKYSKAKEEIQYYHQQLYRKGDATNPNHYADFMSIFSALDKYINGDENIYNLSLAEMKDAISKYNTSYDLALEYVEKLGEYYKGLEADGVSRKMFTDRTEALKYLIMSKTKNIERLAEIYNYKLGASTEADIAQQFKEISLFTSAQKSDPGFKAIVDARLSPYRSSIADYDIKINMVIKGDTKSKSFDDVNVDKDIYYHMYGKGRIKTAKELHYDSSTGTFRSKDIFLVDDTPTMLSLIKLDSTAPSLFDSTNPLVTAEMVAIKTNSPVSDEYLFLTKDGKETRYGDIRSFESLNSKLSKVSDNGLYSIGSKIYFKKSDTEYYEIDVTDNTGVLIDKADIINKSALIDDVNPYTNPDYIYLINNKLYIQENNVVKELDLGRYYIYKGEVFKIISNVGRDITITKTDGNRTILNFHKGIKIINTTSGADYIASLITYIQETYKDTSGNFDYDVYRAAERTSLIHDKIIELVEILLLKKGDYTFYLDTLNTEFIGYVKDVILGSSLKDLISLKNNYIDTDYPSVSEDKSQLFSSPLFRKDINVGSYTDQIDDYIKNIVENKANLSDNIVKIYVDKLNKLRAEAWSIGSVYDLYDILRDYSNAIKEPSNLKAVYEFDTINGLRLTTTVKVMDNDKLLNYEYIGHSFGYTDEGLIVKIVYTENGQDFDLDNQYYVKINNKSMKMPVVVTLKVNSDLTTTAIAIERISVDTDKDGTLTHKFIGMDKSSLQEQHGLELFTVLNGIQEGRIDTNGKKPPISLSEIDSNLKIQPFDASKISQKRDEISDDNIKNFKKLMAYFGEDIYTSVFSKVVNDTIIEAYINEMFGSMAVFNAIDINIKDIIFKREIAEGIVTDTVGKKSTVKSSFVYIDLSTVNFKDIDTTKNGDTVFWGKDDRNTYKKLLTGKEGQAKMKDLLVEKLTEFISNYEPNEYTYTIKNGNKIITADNLDDINIKSDMTISITTTIVDIKTVNEDEPDNYANEIYEYISDTLLYSIEVTVADNSNYYKDDAVDSPYNTNKEFMYTMYVGNVTLIFSYTPEIQKAYVDGLDRKLNSSETIFGTVIKVLPVTVIKQIPGMPDEKKDLNTLEEQYEYYKELFSSLDSLTLQGYIDRLGYRDLSGKLLNPNDISKRYEDNTNTIDFTDVAKNREIVVNFLAEAKINYIITNESGDEIYGSLHDYRYLAAVGTRVPIIDDTAVKNLNLIRLKTYKQIKYGNDYPVYNLVYDNEGFIRKFVDFEENKLLYYSTAIALSKQVKEGNVFPFKIYYTKLTPGTPQVLKLNNTSLLDYIGTIKEDYPALASLYYMLYGRAVKLGLSVTEIDKDEGINRSTLSNWVTNVLLASDISTSFILHGAEVVNNITKKKHIIPLYTPKLKRLIPSTEIEIESFKDDENNTVNKAKYETNKETIEFVEYVEKATTNILLLKNIPVTADFINDAVSLIKNFISKLITNNRVNEWIESLHTNNYDGTAISYFHKKETGEFTLYLYKGTVVNKLSTSGIVYKIDFKEGQKISISSKDIDNINEDFAAAKLNNKELFDLFKEAYLSVDVTGNDAMKNILFKTITNVNGLNDELFVNPLLIVNSTNSKVNNSENQRDEDYTEDIEEDIEPQEEEDKYKERNASISLRIQIIEDFFINPEFVQYIGGNPKMLSVVPYDENKVQKIMNLQKLGDIKDHIIKYKSYFERNKNKDSLVTLDKLFIFKTSAVGGAVGLNIGYTENFLNADIKFLSLIDKDDNRC